jgi:sortase A
MTLWSPARVKAWEESLAREAPDVLAVLKIPRLHLEVPVLEGTDDWTLNRGAGHIEDTSRPSERGNVGIAGHRDGFFRPLKDLAVGDVLELEIRGGTERYRVEKIWIVNPEDVSVLDPTPSKAVTLVTCYPFYFVGAAPQRFIARAVPDAR